MVTIEKATRIPFRVLYIGIGITCTVSATIHNAVDTKQTDDRQSDPNKSPMQLQQVTKTFERSSQLAVKITTSE